MNPNNLSFRDGMVIMFILFSLVFCGFCIFDETYKSTQITITATVSKKESTIINGKTKFLIFTNNGVYEVTDTFVYGLWNSADVYNEIKEGKTYEFAVVGWRKPLFSWFQNIIAFQEVDTNDKSKTP